MMKNIINKLIESNLTIALAESMTGGYVSSKLTAIPNSSKAFKGAIIAYSEDIKTNLLKVSKEDIEKHSTVSAEILNQMNDGLKNIIDADIYLSITGNAGPGYEKNSNGLKCYILIEYNNQKHYEIIKFTSVNRLKNIKSATNKVKEVLSIILL